MSALSLGIIGGADGPTVIFVTGSVWGLLLPLLALLVLGLGLFLLWRKKRKK